MNLIEKIFALSSISPFDRLQHSELILTADIAKTKEYNIGDTIQIKEQYVYSIFIVINGKAVTQNGTELEKIFGIQEVLDEKTFTEDIIAHTPTKLITIGKAHFFTLLYECPDLLLGLLNLRDDRGLR